MGFSPLPLKVIFLQIKEFGISTSLYVICLVCVSTSVGGCDMVLKEVQGTEVIKFAAEVYMGMGGKAQ